MVSGILSKSDITYIYSDEKECEPTHEEEESELLGDEKTEPTHEEEESELLGEEEESEPTNEEKIRKINNFIVKYSSFDVPSIPHDYKGDINKLYLLFIKNIHKKVDPENDVECFYYGVYFNMIRNNPDLMKRTFDRHLMYKYYLMAISKFNMDAIIALAINYSYYEDYDKAEYYYLLGIEIDSNSIKCMNKLAVIYYKTKKYDLMEKYYLMAIRKGDCGSMCELGLYYKKIKNYELMKKYYLMAIKKGDTHAMILLGNYYEEKNETALMEQCYWMAYNRGNEDARKKLSHYLDNRSQSGRLFTVVSKKYF
jgi:hypothetical protein